MAIEIVDFPINSMVDLSMAKCGRSPEGKSTKFGGFDGILWAFLPSDLLEHSHRK